MNARPGTHDGIVTEFDTNAGDFPVLHVVHRTAEDSSGELRHHDVTARFQRDIAKVSVPIRLQLADGRRVFDVGRAIVQDLRTIDGLAGFHVDHVARNPAARLVGECRYRDQARKRQGCSQDFHVSALPICPLPYASTGSSAAVSSAAVCESKAARLLFAAASASGSDTADAAFAPAVVRARDSRPFLTEPKALERRPSISVSTWAA